MMPGVIYLTRDPIALEILPPGSLLWADVESASARKPACCSPEEARLISDMSTLWRHCVSLQVEGPHV